MVNATTDSQIVPLAEHFRKLGKKVIACFDRQTPEALAAITAAVDHVFESPESNFEKMAIKGAAEAALRRFGLRLVAEVEWPPHLAAETPTAVMNAADLQAAIRDYLSWAKGAQGGADLLAECTVDEMPAYIRDTLAAITAAFSPPPLPAAPAPQPAAPPAAAAAQPSPPGDSAPQAQ